MGRGYFLTKEFMSDQQTEITLRAKLTIFINWGLKLCGIVFICLCAYTARFGVPKVFERLELAEIQDKLDLLAMSQAEIQDVQVALVQKRK
jgi:hypothetical protein